MTTPQSAVELADALRLVLPLAKGYAAAHRVGSNQQYVEHAAEVLERFDLTPAQGDDIQLAERCGHGIPQSHCFICAPTRPAEPQPVGEFAGIKVVANPTLPPGTVQLRDGDNRILASIVNLATEAAQPGRDGEVEQVRVLDDETGTYKYVERTLPASASVREEVAKAIYDAWPFPGPENPDKREWEFAPQYAKDTTYKRASAILPLITRLQAEARREGFKEASGLCRHHAKIKSEAATSSHDLVAKALSNIADEIDRVALLRAKMEGR